MLAKIKNFIKSNEKDLFIAIIIVMVAFISFGLGRLSKIKENKPPITIENIGAAIGEIRSISGPETGQEAPAAPVQEGLLVGSKNGTKYHYPWCSGAQRIKEENKVWFSSIEEARKAGYTPAANCKGL